MLDPEQLCGVPRTQWDLDPKYVQAVQQGRQPPWSLVRGVRHRLLLELVEHASVPGVTSSPVNYLRAVRALADAALPKVRCARAQCSFSENADRSCARVQVHHAPLSISPRLAGDARAHHFLIVMGSMGGACYKPARRLQQLLWRWIPRANGSFASSLSTKAAARTSLPSWLPSSFSRLRLRNITHRPYCEAYCRQSYRLRCPSGFSAAISKAITKHRAHLQADPSEIALLTFVYAAELGSEWRETLVNWREDSFGFGAGAVFLAASWMAVLPRGHRAKGGLPWDAAVASTWRLVFDACVALAPSRCVLRTVLHHNRMTRPGLYRAFERRILSLAPSAVGVLPWFNATWHGVQLGLMRHHDNTRIHFADTARIFLAQLTLNILPLVISPQAPLPPPVEERRIDVRRLRTNRKDMQPYFAPPSP
uniref:Uncharacterized protein n=1 Tax=Calcidiscus leptoporus TaxID=127549 RepID=A0A7S0IZF9_9EUKA|mmetsp:Transcript_31310/g.72847  ORF Transcript_31310/g.72847 Transcript_31310/m.72847 type:complete len:423 (+) Transcript_31310:488-1756(+)